MTIRPATATDQPAINRLIRQAGINRMSLHWPNFLVAEEGGAIVGVGQIKTHSDHSLELASLAVVPARQHQGIARALVERLIELNPGAELHLTCRRELESFYSRFGFRRLQKTEYPSYFRRLIPAINLVARWLGTQILVMRRDVESAAAGSPG